MSGYEYFHQLRFWRNQVHKILRKVKRKHINFDLDILCMQMLLPFTSRVFRLVQVTKLHFKSYFEACKRYSPQLQIQKILSSTMQIANAKQCMQKVSLFASQSWHPPKMVSTICTAVSFYLQCFVMIYIQEMRA